MLRYYQKIRKDFKESMAIGIKIYLKTKNQKTSIWLQKTLKVKNEG